MPATLPPPDSIWPADMALRAAVTWGPTQLVTCSTCHGPAIVGYLDARPVAYACQRCGPIHPEGNSRPPT